MVPKVADVISYKLLKIYNLNNLKDTVREKKDLAWLTYDKSRTIRDVKRGQVYPSRNTCTFHTVLESHF